MRGSDIVSGVPGAFETSLGSSLTQSSGHSQVHMSTLLMYTYYELYLNHLSTFIHVLFQLPSILVEDTPQDNQVAILRTNSQGHVVDNNGNVIDLEKYGYDVSTIAETQDDCNSEMFCDLTQISQPFH